MIPFMGELPERIATREIPKIQIANNWGDPILNTTGCNIGTLTARSKAPKIPPIAEAENAAPNARPACPFFAIG